MSGGLHLRGQLSNVWFAKWKWYTTQLIVLDAKDHAARSRTPKYTLIFALTRGANPEKVVQRQKSQMMRCRR